MTDDNTPADREFARRIFKKPEPEQPAEDAAKAESPLPFTTRLFSTDH